MSVALLDRIVDTLAGHGTPSRFARIATTGAALTIAPIKFLTQRVSASETICGGQTCSAGACCCDGFTVFCCQLVGESNAGCPSGTTINGWWRCSCYQGSGLCSDQPTCQRFYLDCSNINDTGSCTCGRSNCAYRLYNCNYTPYRNCSGVAAGRVICRLITCTNPGFIACTECTTTIINDNTTCDNEAPCLGGQSCTGSPKCTTCVR